MNDDKKYNGWSNYETWVVNLWLTNEPNDWDEQAREADSVHALADSIKDFVEENSPEVTGLYADLLNAAISEVDWHEIAEGFFDAAWDADLEDRVEMCQKWNISIFAARSKDLPLAYL